MNEVEKIIETLEMQPHPEGGFFKEVYRSNEFIKGSSLPDRYEGKRNFCTSIYYMLVGEQTSSFHKLLSDEIWHHYLGSTIILHFIDQNGKYSQVNVGSKILDGETPQFTIPKGIWFAAELKDKSSFTLIGCTVSPGFDFKDFTIGKKEVLLKLFLDHKELINKMAK